MTADQSSGMIVSKFAMHFLVTEYMVNIHE